LGLQSKSSSSLAFSWIIGAFQIVWRVSFFPLNDLPCV
jgi:hypothetical protein